MIEAQIRNLLEDPMFERLKDWYSIGPVQRATLEEFCAKLIEQRREHASQEI